MTDVGIIQMRRRLLKEALDLERGVEPYAATHGDGYRIHTGDSMLPADVANWAQDRRTKQALAAKW